MSSSSQEYNLGRVQKEAGTIDPVEIWQRAVQQAETMGRYNDNQKTIIEGQKVALLEARDQVSALRAQLRRAGVEPCV